MMANNKNLIFIGFAIVVSLLFYLVVPVQGHIFWGDYALYIQHAINIAELEPYSKTGYVFNPEIAFFSPQNYPPVYPVLLAPIYKIFGINYVAFKLLNLSAYILYLYVIYKYFLGRITTPSIKVFVFALIAFCPWYFTSFKLIVSDYVFLLFFSVALVLFKKLFDRFKNPETQIKSIVLLSLAAGLFIYLAYGSRTAGIALIPAAIVSVLWGWRLNLKIILSLVLMFGVFSSFILLQESLYGDSISYTKMLSTNTVKSEYKVFDYKDDSRVKRIVFNAITYANLNIPYYINLWQSLWYNGFSKILRTIVIVIMNALMLFGAYLIVRKREIEPMDILVLIYSSMLLMIPFQQGSRYLLPLLPVLFLYSGVGLEKIKELVTDNQYKLVSVFVMFIALISYSGYFGIDNWRSVPNNVTIKSAQQLSSYIRGDIPEETVIISIKPRIFALKTGRKFVAYKSDNYKNLDAFMNFIKRYKAQYAMLSISNLYSEGGEYYRRTLANNSNIFQLQYMNKDFALYRIKVPY